MNSSSKPAKAGSTVMIYVSGLGAPEQHGYRRRRHNRGGVPRVLHHSGELCHQAGTSAQPPIDGAVLLAADIGKRQATPLLQQNQDRRHNRWRKAPPSLMRDGSPIRSPACTRSMPPFQRSYCRKQSGSGSHSWNNGHQPSRRNHGNQLTGVRISLVTARRREGAVWPPPPFLFARPDAYAWRFRNPSEPRL